MKKLFKSLLTQILGWQVRRLRKKSDIKVVAIAGSVGKTTVKHVVAQYLKSSYRVIYQTGNYNVPLTVPLVFFDEEIPQLTNPVHWLKLLLRNESKIRDHYPYDIVVVELGIDSVGEMDQFAKYIQADVSVLTSIAPEHMEFFADLDEVAGEELKVADFSEIMIAGIDDIPEDYRAHVAGWITYGLDSEADYKLFSRGQNITIKSDRTSIQATTVFVGQHVQKALAAAVAVAHVLGLEIESPEKVLAKIEPMHGRMRLFEGINGSQIIDDTYNNVSPLPVKAALDVLYDWPASKRIAVLGNMNELGRYSKDAHIEVGQYCDPKRLDLIITIGPDSSLYIADEARKKGCEVVSFESPYEVGEYLKTKLDKNTVVLLKGSQNRVYLEEAVKKVLANLSDIKNLVRQSDAWLNKKQKQFGVKV